MRKLMTVWLILVIAGLGLWPAGVAPARAQQVNTSIDIGLIIDNSGSMKENDPAEIRYSAAKLFINLLAKGDQVGVVSMGEGTTTKTKLGLSQVTQYASLAREAFKTPDDFADYTYMGESLDLTAQLMENAAHYNPQRAVILLTDGLPTYLDEDRAAQEAKFAAAVARFQAERIKVFPIALGNAADVNFLQQNVAAPTGGLVWKAENAEQLVGVFIEILERLQQGRYVDSYEILSGVDTFLANVNPRQQIEQINFVFPAAGGDVPEIQELRLPRAIRTRTSEFSRIMDPQWSLWTANPEYTRGFQGEWRTILGSQRTQVPLIAVIKSELRTQLVEPISSVEGDDAAARFFPAGRKLMLRAAVRNRADDYEKRIGLFVQPEQLAPAEGLALQDEGVSADVLPVDGEYAGMLTDPLQPGQYSLRMHITPSENHLRLQKTYDIVVEPLPTMEVDVEPKGELAAGESARVTVRWALDGQPQTMQAASITAVVRRADRAIAQIELAAQGDGVWEGVYEPAASGSYSFGVTAHAEWQTPDRGLRRYTDYVDVGYAAEQRTSVQVDIDEPEQESVDGLSNGVQRTVTVSAVGDEPVELRLSVEGLPDAEVYPATIVVQPGEEVIRTVTVSSPEQLESGEHEASLQIDADSAIELSTTELPISFRVTTLFERYRLLIVLLIVLVALLLVRRVRAAIIDWIGRNLELLRYGGSSWKR